MLFVWLGLCLAGTHPSALLAASYVSIPTTFVWISPAGHTDAGWSNGSQCSRAFYGAAVDDDITAQIPLGFTFNFGGTNYTSVQIMSNGRLQFNNGYCGYGTQSVGPPRTYPYPYPDNNLVRTMKVYGADLDPLPTDSSGGGTTTCSLPGCRVTYASLGAAPNRYFVVTWSNVPEWGAVGSYFNLQAILYENGAFVYQFGPSNNPSRGMAQIGWELSRADYGLVQYASIGALAGTAVKFTRFAAGTLGLFNAFDSNTPPGSVAGVIQTKIAGQPFNLDIVALRNNGTLDTNYTGAVQVELVDASSGGACTGLPSILSLGTFTFQKRNNGRLTVPNIQFNDARANLRVRISESNGNGNGNNTSVACSTDNFALRPAYFLVTATDTDWQTPGTGRVLNNTAVSGGVVHKAGQSFSVTASAVNAAGAITTGYQNSTPTLTATTVLLPSGGTLGTLSGGAWNVASGVAVSNSAAYSEAGAVSMQMTDAVFAAVDAMDGTPPCQLTIGDQCDSSNNPVPWVPATAVGRFVPDHFSVTASNTPAFKTFNDSACSSRSFTYIGQGFGYATAPQALITAQNAAGATTQNYRGALWRPVPAFAYSSPSGTLDTGLATTPTVVSNNDGTGSENVNSTDLLAYTRNPATPQAAFNANISLNLSVTDPSEAGVAGNGTINTSAPAQFNGTGSGIAFDSGNAFRYGRLKLGNAFGSEALDLPIPIEAQYWNGTVFVTNDLDSCTSLNAGNIALGNYRKGLNATNMGTSHISIGGAFVNGKGSLKLTRPSPAALGSVDLAINLGSGLGSIDQSCPAWTTTSNGAGMAYLRGKWCGANYDRDPKARVTFGIYKNANDFIYMREMY
ncbi:hypothetical protein TPL01_16160 [Sulfuriferula plumbiphila]|uniref:DUF6701 domain-containing protein n=1 Tax=Sulfuriferula plumbiphila TaxID=171865 RepID=A0A512L7M2_9PROT|nr:DUF6701 domain-containing protein [Sulfuriferula plumbiphila]BBP04005.1 hypothetical protein SFPGR_14270 [Sulfuriferula plumbiphila]GEP30478.1 hypothetical protein TPL01_16160 [Sulfuriferula plumbiphila]